MSLIKKIDVPRHFAARRAERRLAAGFGMPPRVAEVSKKAEPVRTEANSVDFREDFFQDHSSPSMIVAAKS